MIYINFVDLLSLVLHAKAFWIWIRFLIFLAILSHGGHLGDATWTIYINFSFPFPKDASHEVFSVVGKAFEIVENDGRRRRTDGGA